MVSAARRGTTPATAGMMGNAQNASVLFLTNCLLSMTVGLGISAEKA
jgi:hypothetical protein